MTVGVGRHVIKRQTERQIDGKQKKRTVEERRREESEETVAMIRISKNVERQNVVNLSTKMDRFSTNVDKFK